MNYEDTQPYRLGRLYKQLGEALMSPKTDMRDLAEIGTRLGIRFKIEVVPDENSPINGAPDET